MGKDILYKYSDHNKSGVEIYQDGFRMGGCRQGDPISPYLFLLCAEVLAIKLRNNKNIQGINIGNEMFLITQFADDNSVFLDGSKMSLETTLQQLNDFKIMSGL